MRDRSLTVDCLKGLAIILVVLGHSIQINLSQPDSSLVFRIIYSFHMPLFMFLSGYVAYKAKDTSVDLRTKFRSLVIPFLAWYFLIDFLTLNYFRSMSLGDYAKNLIYAPDNGLWFLWVLFLCFIGLKLFIAIEKLYKPKLLRSLLLLGIFFLILRFFDFNLLGYQLLAWHLPTFLMGYIVCKYRENFNLYSKQIIQVSLLLFPILLFMWYRGQDPLYTDDLYRIVQNMDLVYLFNDFFSYALAFSGIVIAYSIIKQINSKIVIRLLLFLSAFTLDIYVIHIYLFKVFPFGGGVDLGGWLSVSAIVLTCISGLVLSILISYLFLRKSNIFRVLLLGK